VFLTLGTYTTEGFKRRIIFNKIIIIIIIICFCTTLSSRSVWTNSLTDLILIRVFNPRDLYYRGYKNNNKKKKNKKKQKKKQKS